MIGKTENLTVMFTDIVNYTKITSGQSRVESAAMLAYHDRLLLPIVAAYGGRRVKSMGDALMLSFRSPTDAVHCGMAMLDALADGRSKEPAAKRLHIRVAINLGEVRVERHDLFGEAVNVAARLESLTPADELYFSEAVYLVMNKAEVSSEHVGVETLKGIPEPINIYRVPPFQLSRLVPAGEGTSMESELPFGGQHVARKRQHRAADLAIEAVSSSKLMWHRVLSGLRWPIWLAIGSLAVAALMVFALQPFGPREIAATAEVSKGSAASYNAQRKTSLLDTGAEHLAQGDVDAVRAIIKTGLESNDAQVHALAGQLAMHQEQHAEAVDHFKQALKLRPELANHPLLAQSLVSLLSWLSTDVHPLLQQHPSEAIHRALQLRSGMEGYFGRNQAVQALRDMGRADLIDQFNYAKHELQGRSRCEDRLKAVKIFKQIGDPKAIPYLEQAIEGGIKNWWGTRCMRITTREAITALQSAKAKGD